MEFQNFRGALTSDNLSLSFLDFLIELIGTEKVRVGRPTVTGYSSFDIWLIEKDDLLVRFSYNMSSFETAIPIRRFRAELCSGSLSLLVMVSSDPSSYDKMLKLYRACLKYQEKHDPNYVNISFTYPETLERSLWKKSEEEIIREVERDFEIKQAEEVFQRLRAERIHARMSLYREQGYKIVLNSD